MRAVATRRDSVFFRCARAETDARFPRYPQLPVHACTGYEASMLYVILLNYTKPLADVDAVRARHIEHLERFASQGIFHAWARRNPPSGGVLIAMAPDRAALEAVIAQDPYVVAGVVQPEIVEFTAANTQGVFRAKS
ncbi:MAG TPA: YciI family protein [Gemmatimonadales bacterium]|nr:YciI family protein [Gemmatimonadales bacterium]